MKSLLGGFRIAGLTGAVAMVLLLGFMRAEFDMKARPAGLIILAIPLVFIPAVCGGCIALRFRRRLPDPPTAIITLMAWCLALNGLLTVTGFTLLHGRLGGESAMAVPTLLMASSVLGGVVAAPAALMIRRATITEANGAAA